MGRREFMAWPLAARAQQPALPVVGFFDGASDSSARFDAAPQETADRIPAQYGRAIDDALALVARWSGRPAAEAV
jgi:hypothetical protein